MSVVCKHNVGLLETPLTLHEHFLSAVDQNIADGRIRKQWFDRTKPEDFICKFVNQLALIVLTQLQPTLLVNCMTEILDLATHLLVVD